MGQITNSLITAIINSDIKSVRRIIEENPESLKERDASGLYPVQIAKEKGLKKIETVFLLDSEFSKGFYTSDETDKFIGELISEISEDTYAAGWLDRIEYRLWSIGKKMEKIPDWWMTHRNTSGHIHQKEIDELIQLAYHLDRWAFWDEKIGDVQSIKLSEWVLKFDAEGNAPQQDVL